MNFNFTGWFGFWLFVTFYTACESVLFIKGYDTLFWQHKTQQEKQLQENIINNSKGDVK